MGILGFILLLGYAALVPIYLMRLQRWFSLLKAHEPALFSRLGEPHLILNNTPRTNAKVLPYLLRGSFSELANSEAKALASSVRRLLIAGLALFPLSVALLVMGGFGRA